MQENCSKMNDGNIGGGLFANASYNIPKSSIKTNMGKLGYIDSNSQLYSYPTNEQSFTNSYKTITGLDSLENDIPGTALTNTTLQKCESLCNSNADCAGFVSNAAGTSCWPKTTNMYPFGGESTINSDRNIYIRNRIPKTPPHGVSQNTFNTDTITYQNYISGGDIGNNYGLANVNTTQKQQLEQLQTKMNLLSSQITNLTTNFQVGTDNKITESFVTGISSVLQQSQDNISGIRDYETEMLNINEKVKSMSGEISVNMENILKDSDIIVLQKNYEYLFWSILAVGTVMVSMNIIKKQ